MGNIADRRRLREAKGLYKDNPGDGTITKNELNYIPNFIGKANNPTDEKPAIYNGVFNLLPSEVGGKRSVIELEAKRSGGRIRLTCEANDEHNRAIFECVERFIEAIYTDTARKITTPTEDRLSQMEKDNKVLEAELKRAKQSLDIIKKAI